VIWIVAHLLGIDVVPHGLVLPQHRGGGQESPTSKGTAGPLVTTVRWFSGVCRISSVFDGLDECRDGSVAVDIRLSSLAIGARISYAANLSERIFDGLFTVPTTHPFDGDGLTHIH
jgi:hypothetical protein